jgi:DNA polymerase III epsilon subunit family exonuclease
VHATAYAVVDLETTGLSQHRDRIVEVAVIRLNAAGAVTHEYASLINPSTRIAASHIHGITDHDVQAVPSFAKIARAVAARLLGAVLVGHNVRFDLEFLGAEYARLGLTLPELPSICTRRLARRLGRHPDTWALADCCIDVGVALEGAHTALGDAHATARLFTTYLAIARGRGGNSLEALGCTPLIKPPWRWTTGLGYLGHQYRRDHGHR